MDDLYSAESYVIGRCLVDSSLVAKAVRAGVRHSDFIDNIWNSLWAVIESTGGRNLPARELAMKIKHVAPLSDVAKAIVSACEYAPTSCYFDFYCKRIIELSVQRESADIAEKISDAETPGEIHGLSEDLQRCQHRLTATGDIEEEAYSVDLSESSVNNDDIEVSGSDAFLLPTAGMDKHIGGPLKHGSLIVVAADSGNFKSSFLLQMFCRNAKHHTCAFMSLEMNSFQVGVRLRAMGHGGMDDAFLVTRPSMNAKKLIARIEELHDRGYDTFAIDYGQLVESSNGKSSLYEQQTRVANDIQDVTKRLGITTVVATQLRKQQGGGSRGNVMSAPGIDDIRDTGRWREAPDVLIMLDKVWERFREADENQASYAKVYKAVSERCHKNGTSIGSAFIVTFAKMRDRAKPYGKFFCQISERGPIIEDVDSGGPEDYDVFAEEERRFK